MLHSQRYLTDIEFAGGCAKNGGTGSGLFRWVPAIRMERTQLNHHQEVSVSNTLTLKCGKTVIDFTVFSFGFFLAEFAGRMLAPGIPGSLMMHSVCYSLYSFDMAEIGRHSLVCLTCSSRPGTFALQTHVTNSMHYLALRLPTINVILLQPDYVRSAREVYAQYVLH